MGILSSMFGGSKSEPNGGKPIPALTDDEMGVLDFIVVVDHSGSMGAPSQNMRGGTRLQEVQEDVQAMANIAEKHDGDGITVVAFDSYVKTYDGVGALKVASVFKDFPPGSSTNLTDALKEAVKKATSAKKEAVVLVYTDGCPNDQQSAMDVIDQAGRTLGRPKIGFTFVQVGNDSGAARFLKTLDDDMKVDVTATVRAEDAKTLTLHQLAWLARND
jgi:Mg-chelatase subunit ChlD